VFVCAGEGQLSFPFRVVFTPANTILVVDFGNNRVQELDLEGGFVRSFAVNWPSSVALKDDMLAVGTGLDSVVLLFSYSTGDLIATCTGTILNVYLNQSTT
jgi:hypothetical protein